MNIDSSFLGVAIKELYIDFIVCPWLTAIPSIFLPAVAPSEAFNLE